MERRADHCVEAREHRCFSIVSICLISELRKLVYNQVTDAVHDKGSYIYLQLWALGRAATPEVLKGEDPNFPFISSSDVPRSGQTVRPRPLTVAGTVSLFLL